jgi:hypothetical protein
MIKTGKVRQSHLAKIDKTAAKTLRYGKIFTSAMEAKHAIASQPQGIMPSNRAVQPPPHIAVSRQGSLQNRQKKSISQKKHHGVALLLQDGAQLFRPGLSFPKKRTTERMGLFDC